MLQVGVDDGGEGRARCQDALDAGAREAAPPDPPDAAHPAILARQRPHEFPGTVRGVVVTEDHLTSNAATRRLQPPKQRGDIIALVEGGNDDRKLRPTSRLRRIHGPGLDGVIHTPAYI